MATILGISAFYHDSAAALVVDGDIVAAAQEERFTRRKHDAGFPRHAIAACLQAGALKPADIDFVAFYDKPFLKFERLLETYLAFAPRGFASFRQALPVWVKDKLFQRSTILKELKASPPGSEKFDFLTMWTTWLQGKTAMLYTWPPTGRISENYAQRDKAFSFLPKSKIVGKVGYAVVPGKNGWFNAVVRCVSADSENQDAAYLFAQWNTSPSVSLQRVMLPYSLRDPYRISHFKS